MDRLSCDAAATELDVESPSGRGYVVEQVASPHIVGIGASAGGLEALERMFDGMPADTGMAFVIVQHLSPDFKSLMDELLARHTEIPIHFGEEGISVEANNIYLLPPKKEMIIMGGKLLLADKDPSKGLAQPIDLFFRSLAQDAGPNAIAVVLSGTGSDGSRGILDIHEAGGLVISESLESAKFDGMPKAAQASECVDRVLVPEEMADALLNHVSRQAWSGSNGACEIVSDQGMGTILRLLNDTHGIDFSHYRSGTVQRRTERRLLMNHIADIDEYAVRLKSDEAELNLLYKDLLIGVTKFYRDDEAFQILETDIIPKLVEQATSDELRIWVAGCATGEEAYSLAILIHEFLNKVGHPIKAKIFATDVHRASLDIASEGIYSRESLKNVSKTRLKNYFTHVADGYRVSQTIRQMIVFAPHNVIKDAPFTKLDLITCRNLLIYFETTSQRKALSLFHFSLRPGGILFLGPSESPRKLGDTFDTIDPHWKFYRKRRDGQLPADIRLPLPSGISKRPTPIVPVMPAKPVAHDSHLLGIYDELLTSYMPAGLLVNERRELVQVFGDATAFLKLQARRISTDVLELVGSELRLPVAGALQRASKERAPASYSNIRLGGNNGDAKQYKMTVRPVQDRSTHRDYMLVLFEELKHAAISPLQDTHLDLDQVSRERMQQLETELRYTKENLQATIEELETSNEELQAANEELVASNEELQSTNEELHSVNEELYTVNGEYQKKISELTIMTGDMDNLLVSTDVGSIFLDGDLRIRKFTPKIGEIFNLLPQDIGRRLETFAQNIQLEDLPGKLSQVLKSGERLVTEVQDHEDNWFQIRLLPYLVHDKIDGVVLTLIDITSLKEAEFAIRDAVLKRDQFLAMLSHELRNPLGAVVNAAHILDDKRAGEEDRTVATALIRRQADQMSYLLGDLLDVTRITQGKIQMRKQVIDLRGTVEDAVVEVRDAIEAAQQHLTVCTYEAPLWVNGNAARLKQVQANLLNNASKYTPDGGHIWLTVMQEGDEAVISVRDDGAGIPADMLDSIFELFVQSDRTLYRSDGGLGVGLTLTKSLVDLHDGSITVRSGGRNQGSEFIVRLPLSTAPKHEVDPAHDDGQPHQVFRIAIVEDDADSREMLRTILQLDGHDVLTAEDGPRGLRLVSQELPRVAFIDIGLPEMDGYEVARRLRGDFNGQIYLIALTGYGQDSDRTEALEAGFNEHIVKPINPLQLSRVLEHIPALVTSGREP